MKLKFSKRLPFSVFKTLVNAELTEDYDSKYGARTYIMRHNNIAYYVSCTYGDGEQNVNSVYKRGSILNTYFNGIDLERLGLLNNEGILYFKKYHKQDLEEIMRDMMEKISEKKSEIEKMQNEIEEIEKYLAIHN